MYPVKPRKQQRRSWILDGRRARTVLELAWLHRPMHLQSFEISLHLNLQSRSRTRTSKGPPCHAPFQLLSVLQTDTSGFRVSIRAGGGATLKVNTKQLV